MDVRLNLFCLHSVTLGHFSSNYLTIYQHNRERTDDFFDLMRLEGGGRGGVFSFSHVTQNVLRKIAQM